MSSIIAQLTRELNSRLSESEINDLVFKEMENLVNILEDKLERSADHKRDLTITGTIHGVRIMAKQIHDALAQEMN